MESKNMIACCGLYCSNCKAYVSGKCPGCKDNIKAEKWCKVKLCCKAKNISNCSCCDEYDDPKQCKKFNNIFSKIFGIVFGSDRSECIKSIKKLGESGYIQHMKKIKSYNNPNKK